MKHDIIMDGTVSQSHPLVPHSTGMIQFRCIALHFNSPYCTVDAAVSSERVYALGHLYPVSP